MESIESAVMHLVAASAGVDAGSITPSSALEGDLYLDSMDKIELVIALEEELDVMITDEEAEACKTVADVVALVERLKGGEA